MCMLIHHPESAEPFERADFADIFAHAPDGFGVIWRSPSGIVRSRRGLLDLNEQWTMYRTLYANGCREMVLHWRFRTRGPVDYANCHPIAVPGTRVLMAHNGASIGPSTADKSDSAVFAEKVLAEVVRACDWSIRHESLVPWLENNIGAGNKLVLWDRDEPTPVIVNERTGLWYRGRWYSNTYSWSVPEDAFPRHASAFRSYRKLDETDDPRSWF